MGGWVGGTETYLEWMRPLKLVLLLLPVREGTVEAVGVDGWVGRWVGG